MKPEHLSGFTWCFLDQTQPIATSWMDSLTAALLPTIPHQDIGVCMSSLSPKIVTCMSAHRRSPIAHEHT